MSKLYINIFIKYCIFLAIVILASFTLNGAVISGNILQSKTNTIQIAYSKDNCNPNTLQISYINPVIKNAFKFTISINKTKIVQLIYKNDTLALYLNPTDSMHIVFHDSSIINTATCYGIGAGNNNCLIKLLNIKNNSKTIIDTSFLIYKKHIDSIYFKKSNLFKTFIGSYVLSNAFKNYVKNELYYEKYNAYANYAKHHQQSDKYKDVLFDNNIFEQDFSLLSQQRHNYIDYFVAARLLKKTKLNHNLLIDNTDKILKFITKKKLDNYYVYRYLALSYTLFPIESWKKMLDIYSDFLPKHYRNSLQQMKKKLDKFVYFPNIKVVSVATGDTAMLKQLVDSTINIIIGLPDSLQTISISGKYICILFSKTKQIGLDNKNMFYIQEPKNLLNLTPIYYTPVSFIINKKLQILEYFNYLKN